MDIHDEERHSRKFKNDNKNAAHSRFTDINRISVYVTQTVLSSFNIRREKK